MNGMFWFNNDPKLTLEQKIERAAAYYEYKYGRKPDMVGVHKSIQETEINGIAILPKTGILKNHFVVSCEKREAQGVKIRLERRYLLLHRYIYYRDNGIPYIFVSRIPHICEGREGSYLWDRDTQCLYHCIDGKRIAVSEQNFEFVDSL